MADKIQLRRDTKARWEQYNPVLASGEPGYELDSLLYKLGDGKTAWNDLPYRGAGGGGGSNIVDSEDITKDDTGISTYLYIADRPVNSAKYVDKGYKILRGIASGIDNVLKQTEMMDTNTIYEIRYDFTILDTITVPEGCVLRFNGGSISGGSLIGKNTVIDSSDYLFKNTFINGTWIVDYVTDENFVDYVNSNARLLRSLFALTQDSHPCVVVINSNHSTTQFTSAVTDSLIQPTSNSLIILNGTITLTPNSLERYAIMGLYDKSNITITGSGSIIGDRVGHTYNPSSSTHEWGYGLYVRGCKNVHVSGITTQDCTGDGIMIGTDSENITIDGIYSSNNRRQGITVGASRGVVVRNCILENTQGTAPSAGVDIEHDENQTIYDVLVENNLFIDNVKGILVGSLTTPTANITIKNNRIIKNSNPVNTDVDYSTDLHIAFNTSNVIVDGLLIDCYVAPTKNQIIAYQSEKLQLRNINVVNHDTTVNYPFLYIGKCKNVDIDNFRYDIEDSFVYGNNPYIVLEGDIDGLSFRNSVLMKMLFNGNLNNFLIDNCDFKRRIITGPNQVGENITNAVIKNCRLNTSLIQSIELHRGDNIQIYDNYFGNNISDDVILLDNCENVVVRDNTRYSTGENQFCLCRLTSVTNATIGNIYDNNTLLYAINYRLDAPINNIRSIINNLILNDTDNLAHITYAVPGLKALWRNNEVHYDGTNWRNTDGTLVDKVAII